MTFKKMEEENSILVDAMKRDKEKEKVNNMLKIIISFTGLTVALLMASNKVDMKVACYEDNATACYLHALPMVTREKMQKYRI